MNNRATVSELLMLLPVAMALLVFAWGNPRLVQEARLSVNDSGDRRHGQNLTGEVLSEYTVLTVPGSRLSATLENALNEVIYRNVHFWVQTIPEITTKGSCRLAGAEPCARRHYSVHVAGRFTERVQISES
jgi:hypothetical protein